MLHAKGGIWSQGNIPIGRGNTLVFNTCAQSGKIQQYSWTVNSGQWTHMCGSVVNRIAAKHSNIARPAQNNIPATDNKQIVTLFSREHTTSLHHFMPTIEIFGIHNSRDLQAARHTNVLKHRRQQKELLCKVRKGVSSTW